MVSAAQAAALSAQPGVQFLTVDQPVVPTGSLPAAGLSASSLATLFPQLDGASDRWAVGNTGAGVGIAVIDSGVTPRADFGSRLVQVQLPTQDGTAVDDAVGHGSAVAGVAAGQSPDGKYIGVAPGATVYAINIARGDGVYTSDVIAGLNWVLQNADQDNIGVVNLSLSQVEPSNYSTNTLDTAVEQLWKKGIVVVAAAGNRGPDSTDFAPGNDPWVITVGASDPNDTAGTSDDSLAGFSSYGTTLDGFSKPEIVAPGRHIITTIPAGSTIAQTAPADHLIGSGYVKISGTSFSAPQVSGAVALLLQQRPNLKPDQIKWLLTHNERPLQGSTAGSLDLTQISTSSHPDNANDGYHWSNWATGPAKTGDFLKLLTSTPTLNQAAAQETTAQKEESKAQTSCTQAATKKNQNDINKQLTDCANHLSQAAAAWDSAAQAWASINAPATAATDEHTAANDYQQAHDTYYHAAAWDNATNASTLQAAASDQAAAWDHAAAWDAATWDAATWDAATWDAAAWD